MLFPPLALALFLNLLISTSNAITDKHQLSKNVINDFLYLQNQARSALRVPPLVWDTKLAQYADSYASERQQDCLLKHSNGPYGENIFWGSGNGWSPAQAAAAWVAERRWYAHPSNSCNGGQDCGHYTQIVWKETKKIGCAMVTCLEGRGVFMTCNYDPPGNFIADEICPVCRNACLNFFGEHAVHCKELSGFKYRHDMVRDVFVDIFKRAEVSAKKEAPVNFLIDPTEGRLTLRPADVLIFEWVGRKHVCVDLTGVSLLIGLRVGGFTVGQAVLKTATCRVTRHEKSCTENQHVFIPFAFDTFGFLAPDAVKLLDRIQRIMHDNVISLGSMDVVFKRIGLPYKKV